LLLLPPPDPEPGQVWRCPVDGAELAWQPPVRFLMGCTQGDHGCRLDERHLRWVEVPGFWLQRTEVTGRQVTRSGHGLSSASRTLGIGEASGSTTSPIVDPDLPVADVAWSEADEHCAWLGRRLPSEAEWERAARGRRLEQRYPWGTSRVPVVANLIGTSGQDRFPAAAPPGSFRATGWGLLDMGGNLWEWCADTYHPKLSEGPKNGEAWTDEGMGRVLRGGSWRRTAELARVSARTWQEASYRGDDAGFRCAMDASEKVGTAQLISRALRVFPVPDEPGRQLESTRLDAADRRYLERRAVSWMMLEGQPWQALPHAVQLVKREPRDRVAHDLLVRLEEQLEPSAGESPVAEIEQAVRLFEAIVASDRRLQSELARLRDHLELALRKAGEMRLERGDVLRAEAHFRLAVTLDPRNPELVRLLRTSGLEPGDRRTWPGDGRQMIWVPPGRFLMGRGRGDEEAGNDEQPARTISVRGLWLDRTEVTNAEYSQCVKAGGCTSPARGENRKGSDSGRHPVVWVDWQQARAYCLWAGKRLPSEAEWEWAARAGAGSRYPWGEEWQDGRANIFGTKPPGDIWPDSAPVGSFAPNRLGLVDMLGNAWEWVADAYHSDFHGAPDDGRAWTQLTGGPDLPGRVIRGGGYTSFPPRLRVSQREQRDADSPSRTIGFRCAASTFN